jgi:hypothetical protein
MVPVVDRCPRISGWQERIGRGRVNGPDPGRPADGLLAKGIAPHVVAAEQLAQESSREAEHVGAAAGDRLDPADPASEAVEQAALVDDAPPEDRDRVGRGPVIDDSRLGPR